MLKIADQIGDNRVEKILHAVFSREKVAYKYDYKNYSEMVEEVQARIDHRHGLILELKKFENNSLIDECLAALKPAEHEDFGEVAWLLQRSYAASLRAGEKSRFKKKLKKIM